MIETLYVLVACEESQAVTKAFLALNEREDFKVKIEAYSCDGLTFSLPGLEAPERDGWGSIDIIHVMVDWFANAGGVAVVTAQDVTSELAATNTSSLTEGQQDMYDDVVSKLMTAETMLDTDGLSPQAVQL